MGMAPVWCHPGQRYSEGTSLRLLFFFSYHLVQLSLIFHKPSKRKSFCPYEYSVVADKHKKQHFISSQQLQSFLSQILLVNIGFSMLHAKFLQQAYRFYCRKLTALGLGFKNSQKTSQLIVDSFCSHILPLVRL